MTHDLVISAPWYAWPHAKRRPAMPEENVKGRGTAPIFQKYDSGGLVNDFQRDPLASLGWDPEDDCAWELVDSDERLKFTPLRKKLVRRRIDDRDVRPIYLPSHNRFYLVVCEVHCELPGFPCADPERICEAGLVVRKRVRKDDNDQHYTQRLGWMPDPHNNKIGQWLPLDAARGGEAPEKLLLEASLPLSPLLPDVKRKPNHAGIGRCIYFAMVPIGSNETEPDGTPRFDPHADYEIRCWVRHHRPECPRRRPCRCCGKLSFSLPTETYRLAEPFDLIGCSYRPVTLHLPDLAKMAAQVLRKPRNLASMALAGGPGARKRPPLPLPPDTSGQIVFTPVDPTRDQLLPNLEFDTILNDDTDKKTGAAIKTAVVVGSTATTSDGSCFFAIPLITIVATFVLKLFLGLVMFLFGLWWMLALKFCLPFISLSGSIKAAASAGFGKLGDSLADFEASMKVSVDMGGISLKGGSGDMDLGGGLNIGGSLGVSLGLRADASVNLGASLDVGGGGGGFRGGASFGGRA